MDKPASRYSEALKRLQHYVAMREAKPLLSLHDPVHSIHTGSEWEAHLNLADLRIVLSERGRSDDADCMALAKKHKLNISSWGTGLFTVWWQEGFNKRCQSERYHDLNAAIRECVEKIEALPNER